jgi:hypothetical protein
MNIIIERVIQPGELNDVLNAAYEPHQRHGLTIAQLFGSSPEPGWKVE